LIKLLVSLREVRYSENHDNYYRVLTELQGPGSSLDGAALTEILMIITDFSSFLGKDKLIPYFETFSKLLANSLTKEGANLTVDQSVKALECAEKFGYINEAFTQAMFDSINNTSENVREEEAMKVFELLISYSYPNARKFVKSILIAFQQKRLSMKALSTYQGSVLVETFSFYKLFNDLQPFYTYIMRLILHEKLKDMDMTSFTNYLIAFARSGHMLCNQHDNRLYTAYLAFYGGKKNMPDNPKLLIKQIWALCLAQGDREVNPMIPNLLKDTHRLHREQPLSEEEMLMLFQVSIFCRMMVNEGKWPEKYAELIADDVMKICESAYRHIDVCRYPEIQEEITKILLKFRIAYNLDHRPAKLYRVDLKIRSTNALIVIEGPERYNDLKTYQGMEILKNRFFHFINYRVVHIDSRKWVALNEKKKEDFIKSIVKEYISAIA